MTGDVQIKQFEASDMEPLLSFLRVAFPGEPNKSDASFWKWRFFENPYICQDNIPLWVVKAGDKIVGQVASIPVDLKVGDEVKRALWLVDYMLLPEYRPGGLAIPLFQVSWSYCKTLLSLGYNENSSAVMRLLRWKPLESINRYQILLFPGHAAKEISHLAPARRLANLLYAPFRPDSALLSAPEDGALRKALVFDSSFDELWSDASTQWPCAVVRSSRFLEWQFMRQPGKKYDVLGYYKNDRLLGYVILFFRKAGAGEAPPKAAISDLCYGPSRAEETIDNLLKGALRLALERKAGSLVTDVLDDRVEARLRHFGFRRVKSSPLFAAKTAEREELIYARSNWFLTRGDSDVSIFEEANF
jgi:Acetyltransferase (GNAT) domain